LRVAIGSKERVSGGRRRVCLGRISGKKQTPKRETNGGLNREGTRNDTEVPRGRKQLIVRTGGKRKRELRGGEKSPIGPPHEVGWRGLWGVLTRGDRNGLSHICGKQGEGFNKGQGRGEKFCKPAAVGKSERMVINCQVDWNIFRKKGGNLRKDDQGEFLPLVMRRREEEGWWGTGGTLSSFVGTEESTQTGG